MYQVEGTVRALVIDPGSHTLKAGTGGEDLPQTLIPSSLACVLDEPGTETTTRQRYRSKKAGYNAVTLRKDDVEIVSAFNDDGLVCDWDLYESLLSHTLHNELTAVARENGVLLAEPTHNGRKERQRVTELMFEKFEVPALYLARSAVLAAYANGKTTGVVLDVGHSGTSAVPVEDGVVISGKAIRTAMGGRTVNEALRAVLAAREVKLRPLWSFKRTITSREGGDDDTIMRRSSVEELRFGRTTRSFADFSETLLLEEVKHGLCAVQETAGLDARALAGMGERYELPDGNTIELDGERFAIAEQTLFSPLAHVLDAKAVETRLSYVRQFIGGHNGGEAGGRGAGGTGDGGSGRSGGGGGVNGGGTMGSSSAGLHGLLTDAVQRCDSGIHRDLYAGVCVTGGTADMTGLYERVCVGLLETYHKTRVLAASGRLERKYCAWTGGSILATFAEHQKNWVSKSEYEENGVTFIHRKCQ